MGSVKDAMRRARSEAELLDAMRREFPGLRVVDKAEDSFSRFVDRALRVLTLGGQSHYLDRYTTVIGRTIYVPSEWDRRSEVSRMITLRHEAIHLRQFRRYGAVAMSALYLLPIVPMGLALGRARLEWEAYRETLRATAELAGLEAARDPRLREHVVAQFTSAAYGYMWPFPSMVERWIDAALAEIEAELRAVPSR